MVTLRRGEHTAQMTRVAAQFRNWCRPNPDFLWILVGPPNCMRLSAKKAASFLPASAALQEIREAIGLFVVFSQGKPHLAILTRPSNCETALVLLMEKRVVDVRPNFLESEGAE